MSDPVSQQTPADVASEYAAFQFKVLQLIGQIDTLTLVKVIDCTNNGGLSPVGTVTVQPLINQIAGDGTPVPHGQLYKLPYSRLQGGTNAVILDPQPNDLGIVGFCSRDISAVKSADGVAQIKAGSVVGLNPSSFRTFSMSDGIYFGGLLNGVPVQYVMFATAGITVVSPTMITLQAPAIKLDGPVTATSTVAATGDVTAAGISLEHHVHSGVVAGGANSGPPVP